MQENDIVASVIVIVRNDPRIQDCLESLQVQSFPADKKEIIVIDNSSTDCTLEIIQKFPVTSYKEAVVGMGWARNKGLKVAKGEYIVFIDADCIAQKDWLEMLLQRFNSEKIGAVGGRILKQKGKNLIERASRDLVIGQQMHPQYLPMFPTPYVVTANVAYRRDILTEIGGFDPSFFSGADVDISWRLSLAGYHIVTQPQAVVLHANRQTTSAYFNQFYRYGLGHALLFKKYRSITNQRFLINKYPFVGLWNLISKSIPVGIQKTLIGKFNLEDWAKLYLNLIEYLALICGDIHGAIRFRVPYL